MSVVAGVKFGGVGSGAMAGTGDGYLPCPPSKSGCGIWWSVGALVGSVLVVDMDVGGLVSWNVVVILELLCCCIKPVLIVIAMILLVAI